MDLIDGVVQYECGCGRTLPAETYARHVVICIADRRREREGYESRRQLKVEQVRSAQTDYRGWQGRTAPRRNKARA